MEQVPHAHKTAIVTGAAGGLGKAIAEQFLREGANVVVCDINQDLIAEFKATVSPAYPDCTLVLNTDITKEDALDKLFEEAEKKFGKIDYVINSAGRMDRFDPAGEVEKAMWDAVIALNLTAPTMVTKRAVNHMLKHEVKGSIVNIASIAGLRGFMSGVAYTASKHGLIGLTKNTAVFYGPKGIRCNAVMPGGMQTNISKPIEEMGINMEGYEIMVKAFPGSGTNFPVEVDKAAKIVTYLCSDAGSIVNGACWTADAGTTAN